jgi:iron complex transport system permease protein
VTEPGALATTRRDQRRRARAAIALLLVALILLVFVSLCVGRYPVSLDHVVRLIGALLAGKTEAFTAGPGWSDAEAVVVNSVRLPRVIVATFAGAGLGVSGAVIQGLFRNPLTGPHVLGISSGAAWGGVLAILLGLSAVPMIGVAFGFAFIALVLVFLLDRLSGASNLLSLILAGVIVSAFFSALVGLAQYFADAERQLPGIVFWLLGSFAAATSRAAWIIGVPTALAGGLLIALRWRINVLSLGETDAKVLGIATNQLRWIVLSLVTVIVAAQVAVSGAIGWVGLVVPHIARRLVGPNHQDLVPASALLGAVYLLLVDDVARTMAANEVPIGVLTALIGTPVFAIVFWKSRAQGWSRD